VYDYNTILDEEDIHQPQTIVPKTINHLLPWAFFDGSA